MIASTLTVGCGLTLCIAFWADESSAKPPAPLSLRPAGSPRVVVSQTYDFDGFVVTVTPGVDSSLPLPLAGASEPFPVRSADPVTEPLATGIEVVPATFTLPDTDSSTVRLAGDTQDQALNDLPPLPLDDPAEPGAADKTAPPETIPTVDTAASSGQPAHEPGLENVMPCSVGHAAAEERARLYRVIYDSIPFSRPEYDVNPSYRHEATMEILLGQLRPMTIHRNTTNVEVSLPGPSIIPGAYNGYGMNSFYYPFYASYGPYPFPHGRGGRIHRGW